MSPRHGRLALSEYNEAWSSPAQLGFHVYWDPHSDEDFSRAIVRLCSSLVLLLVD